VVREPLLELPAPEELGLELLPLLLGDELELPDPCAPLLLFVLKLEPLWLEPEGSLMLLPRELGALLRDEPLVSVP
jgi:hypothetical protein